MGLDSSVKESGSVDLTLLKTKVKEAYNELDQCFREYCIAFNVETPERYHNKVWDEFSKLDSTKEMKKVCEDLSLAFQAECALATSRVLDDYLQ